MTLARCSALCAVVLSSLISIRPAAIQAAPLTSVDAAVIAQSTFMDSDLVLLGDFVGFQPGQSFTYDGSGNAPGWTATVTGSYLGAPLAVTYSGSSAGFPGRPITWSSTGSFGAQAWSSSGSTLITSTATSFQVQFADMLTIGAQQSAIAATINGIIDPDSTQRYTTTAGTLITPTFSGTLPDNTYSYRRGRRLDSIQEIETNFLFGGRGVWDDVSVLRFVENPPGEYLLRNVIVSTPEPSTVLLFGSALMGLACVQMRRRPGSQHKAVPHPIR